MFLFFKQGARPLEWGRRGALTERSKNIGPSGGRGAAGRGGRGRGRAGWASSLPAKAPKAPAAPKATGVQEKPSAIEQAADQECLATIRKIYGSRARTLINILLAFDSYFAWYYPLKASIPFGSSVEVKEARAFDNCCSAIDMQEMLERISASSNGHGSFLPHGAVFKVSRDILEVGDIWAHDLSPLELQNAESKRVFETGGARALQFSTEGTTHKKTADGEYRIITTKGYGGTAAVSTLTKMLATSQLRAGDGMFTMPASRKAERLFGEKATGRTKHVKLEYACDEAADYRPENDTCLHAFVRNLAARAKAA